MNISADKIDEVLRESVAQGDFPGVVAGVVLGNGTTYTSAFGQQSVAEGIAMREDSIFRIASMIKPVIAVAALQLYDAGLFELDDPAVAYLPEIANCPVLEGFDNDGKPVLREPASQITIRQLFSQTSGSAYEMLNDNLLRYVEDHLHHNPGVERTYRKMPLIDDPGKRWHYGYSTNWLADLIETLSRQTLSTYFAEKLFEPLGMTDTYCTRMPAEKEHRLVTNHIRQADGSLEEAPQEIWDPPYCGRLGLVSTAADYMSFMRMILNRGLFDDNRMLRSETVEMMAQNQIGDLHVVKMKSTIPQFTAFELFPEFRQDNKWGLGMHLNGAAVPGGRSRYSLSWGGRHSTHFWIDLKQQVASVLLLQVEPFGDPKTLELLECYERAVYTAIS